MDRQWMYWYLDRLDEKHPELKIPAVIAEEYEIWRRTDEFPSEESMIFAQTYNAFKELFGEYPIELISNMWLDYMGTEAMRLVLNKMREIV